MQLLLSGFFQAKASISLLLLLYVLLERASDSNPCFFLFFKALYDISLIPYVFLWKFLCLHDNPPTKIYLFLSTIIYMTKFCFFWEKTPINYSLLFSFLSKAPLRSKDKFESWIIFSRYFKDFIKTFFLRLNLWARAKFISPEKLSEKTNKYLLHCLNIFMSSVAPLELFMISN